jgi:hypothetical protein
MASTWVAKPRVHAEDCTPRKIYRKKVFANDENYSMALAA